MNTSDRNTIIRLHEDAMRDCIAHPPGKDSWRYVIRSTSGTTESGPMHVLYEFGPEAPDRYAAQRTLLCMGQMGIRLTNVVTIRRIGRNKKMLCADPHVLEEDGSALLDDFAPDQIFGMTSFVLAVMKGLREATARALRSVMLTGEYLTVPIAEAFQELSPEAALTQVYATSETGLIAKVACGFLPLNAYHPLDNVEVEIADANDSGVGTVLLSKTFYKDIRVERYVLGDVGSLSHEECDCGDTRTLRLYGRSGHDHLKLAGALLHKEEFDRVAALCGEYIDDYRAEGRAVQGERGVRGCILLRVFRSSGVLDKSQCADLAKRFSEELFVTPTQTLADLVRKDIFLPLEIETVTQPFTYRGKPTKLSLRDQS